MTAPGFLVHDEEDSVGVVVVEAVTAGSTLNGLSMESGKTLSIEALSDIPLGHKIALRALTEGETVLKYGHDIGRIVAAVKAGGHVHVHNMKTKRW